MAARDNGSVRKLIAFDAETWQAVDLLARDSLKSIQELADEAFRDLLEKHRRPTTLKQALRASASGKNEAPRSAAAEKGVKRRRTTFPQSEANHFFFF